MPVSYNFCAKATNTSQLIRCIKEHISKISKAGFLIVATVCDQGTSNVAAIKHLLYHTDMKRNFERKTQGKFLNSLLYDLQNTYVTHLQTNAILTNICIHAVCVCMLGYK